MQKRQFNNNVANQKHNYDETITRRTSPIPPADGFG